MTPTTPHEHARALAGAGYRVFPLKPASKAPATRHGCLDGTVNLDEWDTATWWDDDRHGVGVALGAHPTHGYVFAVDIDDHGADGEAVWRDLCDAYGYTEPDDTPEQITGGGGRHLLFSAPHEIRNGELGPDVQTRGEGGYIVVEPSIHPDTGQVYAWTEGREPWTVAPAPAPAWLLAHLEPPERVIRERVDDPNDTRPGTRWMRETSWASILEADGWTHAGAGRQVDAYWTRPGKQRGISASQGYQGSDVLKVFTSSVPWLTAERTYDKLGYIAARDHGGDIAAASRWAADQLGDARTPPPESEGAPTSHEHRTGKGATPENHHAGGVDDSTMIAVPNTEPDPTEGAWTEADPDTIDAIYHGDYNPPTPSILQRTDGAALLYAGKVHSIAGTPGCGKTWIALTAIAEILAAGGHAMLIDYEDNVGTAVRRLISLGVPHADAQRFHYITPGIAYRDGMLPANVVDLAARCELVVTDSVGEALSHGGQDQNSDTEVAAWMRNTARRLTHGGATVLILDHVTKDAETRGGWPIGSQRKLAAIDGIAYMAKAITAATKDKEGVVRLKVSKDRGGHYQHGTDAATIHITPNGDGTAITVYPPQDHDEATGEWMPTALMEKVSRHLEGHPSPLTGRQIAEQIRGKTDYIRVALGHLERLGHITTESGPRNSVIHRHATPYRDPESTPTAPQNRPRPDRAPTAPRARSQNAESDRAPAPPVLTGARSRSGGAADGEHTKPDDRAPNDHTPSPPPFDVTTF